MMKKLALAAMLVAILTITSSAFAYTPQLTFYAAGSSAQFNTIALAAGFVSGGVCNGGTLTNHWTKSNGASLVDPRSGAILPEAGNIWITWDNDALNGTAGAGRVCLYVAVDSIVGVRAYMANATVSIASSMVGSADGSLVPLWGAGTPLPQAIYNIVNGVKLNAAFTDIRPEDALYATIRTTETLGQMTPESSHTGLGYGPSFTSGTPIYSSQSNKQANPVGFSLYSPDPFTGAAPRSYANLSVGAAPVLVIYNASNTAACHFGAPGLHNIARRTLSDFLVGNSTNLTAIDTDGYCGTPRPRIPIHVFLREPLSGTYNTMEYNVPLAFEIGYRLFQVGNVNGQEQGVSPSLNPGGNCTRPGSTVCATESGNPLWHIDATNTPGSTRGRVVGTSEMIKLVNNTPDSLGYAFWGASNFDSSAAANVKYLTVDGIDPLFAGINDNPSGPGAPPQCTKSNGVVVSCPSVPFTNVKNGGYPIWSMLRAMWDRTDSTNITDTVVGYAQTAAASLIPDFVPVASMQAFRAHYTQILSPTGTVGITGNNGYINGITETGGDVGGAVLSIQSELDAISIADPGGSCLQCEQNAQQLNLWQ